MLTNGDSQDSIGDKRGWPQSLYEPSSRHSDDADFTSLELPSDNSARMPPLDADPAARRLIESYMTVMAIKLPDVGEGVASAEIVEWLVKIGDSVREDQIVVAVMTDKAAVEIPSSYAGTVAWLAGEPGQSIAVGADLLWLETSPADVVASPAIENAPAVMSAADSPSAAAVSTVLQGAAAARPQAAPPVRLMARQAGIDLCQIGGSGPDGRIMKSDVASFLERKAPAPSPEAAPRTEEIKVIGLRRKIAERMAEAVRRAAHFSYIEEVDVQEIERIRATVNVSLASGETRLTLLPFLIRAVARALINFPQMNAHFEDDRDTIVRYQSLHVGIATQTHAGLMVPVLRDAERLSLLEIASGIARLTEAARNGTARREDLSGSTLTITSLGALGGLSTTPVLNLPEVAIIGVNKISVRPVWTDGTFQPRRVMNLSSSFDHRVIDGYDAAQFVQAVKSNIENPLPMLA
jgi:2-oxoisovalerate dehydrogenase E2 component (dihydrolipoyl transacylase)